jgi:hypothetical protein
MSLKVYAEMWLTSDSGQLINVYVCGDCGSLVHVRATHDNWHSQYERVADDAYWGGMNRPIGGGPDF